MQANLLDPKLSLAIANEPACLTARSMNRWLIYGANLLVLAGMIGCGADTSSDVLVDARTLLDRYEQNRVRNDPRHFSELDLGEFLVTQRREVATYYIRFQLFAVVADNDADTFNNMLAQRTERVRAAVRESVQRAGPEQLLEPTLDWLKSELITDVNKALGRRMVRDVVFDRFSFEQT